MTHILRYMCLYVSLIHYFFLGDLRRISFFQKKKKKRESFRSCFFAFASNALAIVVFVAFQTLFSLFLPHILIQTTKKKIFFLRERVTNYCYIYLNYRINKSEKVHFIFFQFSIYYIFFIFQAKQIDKCVFNRSIDRSNSPILMYPDLYIQSYQGITKLIVLLLLSLFVFLSDIFNQASLLVMMMMIFSDSIRIIRNK